MCTGLVRRAETASLARGMAADESRHIDEVLTEHHLRRARGVTRENTKSV